MGAHVTPEYPDRAEEVDAGSDADFQVPKHLYSGGGGTVEVIPYRPDGASAITVVLPAGGVVPFRVRGYRTSGSDATDLLAVS